MVHSGRRALAGEWDSQAVPIDKLGEERARPLATNAERRRQWGNSDLGHSVGMTVDAIKFVKPELSICQGVKR